MEGQKKLLNAKVLCIGAGGLGCPISLYLAAAGVGTIGLADVDVVSPSNLQRQVLFGVSTLPDSAAHAADTLGRAAASAKHALESALKKLPGR